MARPPADISATAGLGARLRNLTDARVALGRHGAGMPTGAAQAFLLDHAVARAAVWSGVDRGKLAAQLAGVGLETLSVDSQAPDRATYLRRPDLGRTLAPSSAELLEEVGATPAQCSIVIADGLSASAVELNAVPLVAALVERLSSRWTLGPIVLASQGRVALSDPIGRALSSRLVIMLIGERPGLSAADSLGAYLTFAPEPGTPDSRRNCISNIREGGLSITAAADQIAALAEAMFRTGTSGIGLQSALEALPSADA